MPLRLADKFSYQILILGALINIVMIVGFVVLLKRAYRRARSDDPRVK